MDSKQKSQLTTGLIVITVGLVFLGGQLNMGLDVGKLWPLVFVFLGVGRILSQPGWAGVRNSAWFMFLAAIFLLNNFRILGLGDTWPLFIVAGGLSIIFSDRNCSPAEGKVQS